MEHGELPHVPPVQHLVERAATEAQEAGTYPEIFDEEHLPDTIERLVEAIKERDLIHTERDRAQALRVVYYEIGRFMQEHHLD